MNIIGLYSPSSGHGKDTVAKIFLNTTIAIPESFKLTWYELLRGDRIDILDYSPWEIKKFAAGPKQIVADLYNVPLSKMEDREWRLQVQPPFSKVPHYLTIEIAETMKKIVSEDVWKDALFNQYKENMKWVISDLRFPCEYEEIKKRGGIVIKIERNNCDIPTQAMDGLLDDYEFDEVIINDEGMWKQTIGQVYAIVNKYKLRVEDPAAAI
jgi:hypothetical protein